MKMKPNRQGTPTVRRNSSMKMKRLSKKSQHGQLNPDDRLSALHDSVVYHIVSFLGFKDACRTSILSKRWKYISDTNPVMDLSNEVFSAVPGQADAYIKIDSFLKYVETRMKRYSKQKLHIKKLTLEFPIQRMTFRNTKVPLENKVEQWVEIAVRNQVEELVLIGPKRYELSDILFTAKSLRCLACSYIEIYDYKGIAGFPSLESLFLDAEVYVDDAILNRIISSSLLLKHLRIVGYSGTHKSIVIPCNSKLETLDLSKNLSIDEGIVTIDSSSLTSFQYTGDSRDGGVTGVRVQRWPIISKDGLLRNLRVLKVCFVSITDEVLDKLLSELVLLETLKLCNCSMLKTIRISSALLKDFRVENCSDLLDVTIDAPCLETFKYKGDFKLTMCIIAVAGCDMSLHVPPSSFYPHRVSKLKRLLKGLSNHHVLKIALPEKPRKPNQNHCPVDIDFDDIDDINPGEVVLDQEELAHYFRPPCDIRELKLNLSTWKPFYSSLSAFIDGVFRTCHPRILSLRVNLRASNTSVESLIRELKEMTDSWEHPLKSFEMEGTNCSDLLEARKAVLDIRLKLHW
ncbi:uncharacterized protein LOC141598653 [Silene latifolia]|uniref:uncharacterized protein LOC141598653 n=1 Tax=Silene latifolia TaxID=37657 RepID=UPI003D77159B